MGTLGQLLMSKRLWVSVIGVAVSLSGVVPQKVAIPLMGAASVLTKLIDMGLFSAK